MHAPSDILHPLRPFAPSSEGPVRTLVATAQRQGDGTLRFHYVLDADDLSALRVPSLRTPRQADELWKHTCFEAFLRSGTASAGEDYLELNFSPSTEWAAYSFVSHRKGMRTLALPSSPRIEVARTSAQLTVEACVATRDLLPEQWRSGRLRVALSAVVEEHSGRIAYWALGHAPDKPDFHHTAGFILEV